MAKSLSCLVYQSHREVGQSFGGIIGRFADTVGHASKMSNFYELSLPKTLDTSTADIIADFFAPLLARATRYDRGVGFFSAAWLKVTVEGMVAFAHNSGRAR